ncbi:NAD-P-binding protein [Trametes meyenii]|nr:NAD-P-binding protein [Trametes meyenii]
MSTKVTIFLTGATGYIGGSVLQRLVQHPNRQDFEISAFVRNADKAKQLEAQFGVKTVVGSLQDLDKLSSLSENAHIVIHTADCDDVNAINAILGGLKARHEKTGDLPALIHTSGLAEIVDDARGEYVSDKVYSDLDIASIEALPPTALHRPVDLLIVAADVAGYVRTHIVLPSVIFGPATGPLFDAGIANPHTISIPLLVRIALTRGSLGIIGKGACVWGAVHIEDTADLYLGIFNSVLSNPDKISHGREGYFFVENGEFPMVEPSRIIVETLFEHGRIIAYLLYANSRGRAERARKEFSWTPKYSVKDFLEGLKSEVELILKREDAKNS